MINSILNAIPPIHPEGRPFIFAFAAITLVLFVLVQPLGWIGLALTIWCALFFRDPLRVTPADANLVISPADGVVSYVGPYIPPPKLDLGEGPWLRISVFMNVFDCHVNRAPIAGTVERIAYEPGKFLNAELDKASEDNERNGFVIVREDGSRIGVVQIAGLVARRIVSFSKEGDAVSAGERIGMIRFGSRLDVYVPDDTDVVVSVGQRAVAGESVLANRIPATAKRLFRRS